MTMKVYNTLNRKKEEFKPLNGNRVNFYACGPTVYDYFHIGNARPLIMFDIFRRYMEYSGFDVNYIVNITDIDDKIINRANKENVDFRVIARKYTDAFFEGIEQLGVRPASSNPRATENIDTILDIIKRLLENGKAYVADGDVYFDISSFKGYGKLSGRDIEQMQAGARIEVDTRKKNPFDFALWKSSKPDEPSWDSPWGLGRPGWHIECSAMSTKYSDNDTLDIHAGGQDLIFPHHENEIAQSEGATGKQFAKYWLHNGFLDIEGEKMSKSLGNFLTVRDILKKYDPVAIRTFFLLKHYRSPIDFSEERMKEAQAAFDRLMNAYAKMVRVLEKSDSDVPEDLDSNELNDLAQSKIFILESMDDDFNTAKAMGHFFDIAKIVNSTDENDENALIIMERAKEIFDTIGNGVFGLIFEREVEEKNETEILNNLADNVISWKEKFPDDESLKTPDFNYPNLNELFLKIGVPATLNTIIAVRTESRKNKNFALSDSIRDELKESGITLEDRPDGTSWKLS
ncbi:cysteine--tRNA ligase [Candidatus Latescibacterota bacterium]